MAKTYEHRRILLAGYVPPAKLLDKVKTLTLDKINFKFTIQSIITEVCVEAVNVMRLVADDLHANHLQVGILHC